jgi:hypothetical protein
MKHIFRIVGCMSLLGGFAWSASAADQTWTGLISDSKCGDSHTQMIAGRYKDLRTSSGAPARECTLACVKAGGKYVFVMNGKVYNIANQNLAALQADAGNTAVQLTGDIQGDTITVSKITMPATK